MKRAMWLVSLLSIVIVACAPTPTVTPMPPTATRVPPTATPVPPSPTPVPPTATIPAPTATRVSATPTVAVATKAATSADCMATNTLEELGACIVAKMPRRDTNGYVVPLKQVQDAWKQVTAQMLAGKCDDIALPEHLKMAYTVGTFTDKQNNVKYCVLMETLDENKDNRIDRGWGTFIVNHQPTRELSIQAPHPLYDIGTETQAMAVFKGVNARSFLLAGSHREANPARSTCQPSTGEGEADAGHNDTSLFFVATQALLEYYNANGKEWTAIQFHGMGASSCPGVDAFLTYGSSAAPQPGEKILDLRANIAQRNPQWVIRVPGETPACNLTGGTNVEGRLLNNVPADQVCTIGATAYTGKFIHIEQKTNLRAAIADWIAAINATWK
jgi:hypothetical protein